MCPHPTDSDGHPSSAAHRWLDQSLAIDGRPRLGTPEAIELVESQPVQLQIAILKACVERLPVLRERWSEGDIYELGEQLYTIAHRLYCRDLPLDESDICDILCLSKHDCGHGADVGAPVDLAVSYMSRNDVSPRLLSALSTYVDGLKGIGSIQAQNVKRKASLVFLLDREDVLGRKHRNVWSQQFTSDLAAMDADERHAWQSLVLTFKLNDRSKLPNTWRKIAQSFARRLGEGEMISRIAGWWPKKGAICRLDTGASHLLKHFVWLIEAVDDVSPFKPTCHELVCALSTVQWKPNQPAAKVVCAAAHYLVKLPMEVAWEPLQALCATASSREEKVRQLATQYASAHNLEFDTAETSEGDELTAAEPEKPWWRIW